MHVKEKIIWGILLACIGIGGFVLLQYLFNGSWVAFVMGMLFCVFPCMIGVLKLIDDKQ